MLYEFVYSFDPWGYQMSVVAESEVEARAIAWKNLPDFYANNCESIECIEVERAMAEQVKGVAATQFRDATV